MSPASRVPTGRQWAIAAGFLGALIAPLALLGWAFGAPIALAALPGVAVGFVVTLQTRSARAGVLATAVMGGLALASTLAATSTPIAALWLALVGVAYGLSGLRGWHRLTTQMAIWCSYIVVNPLQAQEGSKLTAIGGVPLSASAALLTAGIVTAAGLAMALLAGLVVRNAAPAALTPLPTRVAVAIAVACGGLLGVGAAVVLGGDRVAAGEWLLLTVIVLIQPDPRATLRHAAERVGGTLLGVIAAAGLAIALGASPVRSLLALALMITAFAFLQMPGRYWMYVALFTPGVVLIGAPPDQTDALAAARLGFTLAGAAAVALVALAVSRLGRSPAG